MQHDLFSPFLAPCVEDEKLNANKAREIWPGLESVPWTALSEIESVSGAAFCRPPLASSGRMDLPESLKESTLRARQYTDLEAALCCQEPPSFSCGEISAPASDRIKRDRLFNLSRFVKFA